MEGLIEDLQALVTKYEFTAKQYITMYATVATALDGMVADIRSTLNP